MKVLLVVPGFEDVYGKYKYLYKRGFLNPPMSLCYLAAALEKAGHAVKIIDGEAQGLSTGAIIREAAEYKPDLFGLTSTSIDFEKTIALIVSLKGRFPEIPVIFGGTHINIFGNRVLKENPAIDFGCIGDGEDMIIELLDVFVSPEKNKIENVKGLVFRRDGTVIQNVHRPIEPALDRYPFPARHLLNNQLYARVVPRKGYVATASFMSSRGCPYSCIYCAVKNIHGQNVRLRTAENVVEELNLIVNKMRICHVAFNDDCLTLNKERMYQICSGIRKAKLKFTWEGLSRADLVDKELLTEMKQTGLVRLSYGIESGNPRILQFLRKNETLEQISRAFKISREVGIATRGSVLIGVPHETRETVRDTFNFVRKLDGLDEVVINILQPYPGTLVREMILRGEGGSCLVKGNDGFDGLKRFGSASVLVNDLTPARLVSLQSKGFLEFYIRPRNLLRRIYLYGFLSVVRDGFMFLRSLIST